MRIAIRVAEGAAATGSPNRGEVQAKAIAAIQRLRRGSGLARLDLRSRRRPPLELAIPFPRLHDGPVERKAAVVEHGRSRAELLRRLVVMGDEAESDAGGAEVADARLAFLLEALVADREHLVDDEDVRLDVLGDGEAKPRVHSRAVVLDRHVDEVAQLGKGDDAIELPLHLPAREAEERPVEEDVGAARQPGVENRPEPDHL